MPQLLHHTHRVIVVPALHYLALRDPLYRDVVYSILGVTLICASHFCMIHANRRYSSGCPYERAAFRVARGGG